MTTNHHTPFSVGDPLSAQALNSRLSDLDSAIAVTGSFAGCRVYSSVDNQLDVGDTTAYLHFNTEVIDTHGFADLASNDDTLTIPTGMGGYYLITYLLDIRKPGANLGDVSLTLEITGQSATQRTHTQNMGDNGVREVVNITQLASLSAGDTLKLKYQKPSNDVIAIASAEASLMRVG